MIIVMAGCFLFGLISAWDTINTKGLRQLLLEKKIEIIIMAVLFDWGKGIFLNYYLNFLNLGILLIPAGFMILAGVLVKFYLTKTKAQIIFLTGLLWPFFPEVFNTILFLIMVGWLIYSWQKKIVL